MVVLGVMHLLSVMFVMFAGPMKTTATLVNTITTRLQPTITTTTTITKPFITNKDTGDHLAPSYTTVRPGVGDNDTEVGGCKHWSLLSVSAEAGTRAGHVLARLEVSSVAMVTQCQQVWQHGVSICTFSSLAALTQEVMLRPSLATCFQGSQWTVVVVGTPSWAASIIVTSPSLGLYHQRVHWVVVVMGESEAVTPTLPHLSLSLRITWLRRSSRLSEWVVLVGVAIEGKMKVREAARWTGKGGEFMLQVKRTLRPPYLTNFYKTPLRVVSRFNTDKKMVFNELSRCYFTNSGDTDCIGYVGRVLMMIVSSLNLTVDNSGVKSCGVANVPGNRVTVIQQGNADIALGTCAITANRLTVVDFTEFFKVSRSSIVTALPGIIQSPVIVFNVLSWHTWLCLCIYLVVVAGTVWAVGRVLVRVRPDLYLDTQDAIALTTKAFVSQGHDHQPRSVSGRAVIAVSWVVAITMTKVYSGNLTAWLSIPRYERAVDSLADLAERPELTPIVIRNDPNHMMFKNRTVGLLGYFATRLMLIERSQDKHIMQDIVAGKATFFNSDRNHLQKASALNKALGHEGRLTPCGIHLAGQDLRQDYLALMISKNSWFKEQMNQRIRWVRSFGIVSHLYQQNDPPGCLLKVSRQQGGRVLILRQLQGAFWGWLSGIIAAMIIFLFECVSRFLCSG
ncbi:hypothetical protein Pmani_001945 [Petrolisthes manimaculis]|uniref:Ionotropic glutamate receptor C-terminal domain-containing protein n=1 Tax=Petrolisthes manimaculis TaxID=1843537 RepID=A0AAE1UJU0_9EUCA|nr:hypothetical protein Pmani_001945 [Petrolisthes manimaculis]